MLVGQETSDMGRNVHEIAASQGLGTAAASKNKNRSVDGHEKKRNAGDFSPWMWKLPVRVKESEIDAAAPPESTCGSVSSPKKGCRASAVRGR